MRTRTEQTDGIKQDQQFWRDLAAEVGPERYAEPGPMGEWSFADMAGHLLGWRSRTISRLEAAARGEADPAPPWPADLGDDDDAINAWIRSNDADRSPAELVAAYDASYDRLIKALDALPEEQLTTPKAFEWAGDEPLVSVAFTGHLHDEHVPSVRDWLDGR
jgi:hypothetical protein